MIHIKQIKEFISEGEDRKAEEAIESLLFLGPKNVEALKLKATLLHQAGKYDEEFKVWEKVVEIDSHDQEALDYFNKRFMEEQERYYFMDELPNQGKRFLAYPKTIVRTSLIGLLSCTVFLFLPGFASGYEPLKTPWFLFGSFFVLVLLPWMLIIRTFITSIKSIITTDKGLRISTRFKTYNYQWQDIQSIALVRALKGSHQSLSLLIEPSDKSLGPAISIDFSEEHSPIRAKTYLIKEIKKYVEELKYYTDNQTPQVDNRLLIL